MKRLLLLAALLAAAPGVALPPAPAGLTVERAVLLMRHGVRPPTKAPPMPAGTAKADWPTWSVKPGYLTAHGAQAIGLLGAHDRSDWRAAGLLPAKGCPRIRIVADSDQRTIATAEAYAATLAPGCRTPIEHKPQDEADPIFGPIPAKAVAFDADKARAAVLAEAGPAGIAGAEAKARPLLARLDAILCDGAAPSCGVAAKPSDLAPAEPGSRPKLTGALDRGSTAAQILLLEYAEGKPMADVGWGRATAADVGRLSELHALEFRLLARPRYMASANLALILPIILDGLTAPNAAPITMISGHDTNVANLGGLLGLHWTVPGFATDDPAPGGAIILETLRDRSGARFVRALYRSQTLEQLRTLAQAAPYSAVLPIAGCTTRGVAGLCTEAAFRALLAR